MKCTLTPEELNRIYRSQHKDLRLTLAYIKYLKCVDDKLWTNSEIKKEYFYDNVHFNSVNYLINKENKNGF